MATTQRQKQFRLCGGHVGLTHESSSETKGTSAQDFASAARSFGFEKGKYVFDGLNYHNKKFLTEQDIAFLDDWRPPAWLTSDPDEGAAREFKNLLLRKSRQRAPRGGLRVLFSLPGTT